MYGSYWALDLVVSYKTSIVCCIPAHRERAGRSFTNRIMADPEPPEVGEVAEAEPHAVEPEAELVAGSPEPVPVAAGDDAELATREPLPPEDRLLTPNAKFPPVSAENNRNVNQHVESFGSCFGNSVSQVSTPAQVDDYEAGSAPLVNMAETELISLLSEEGVNGLRRLTPRTIEACAEEGIEPYELLPRPLSDFAPADKATHIEPRHQQARHARFETRRIAKLADVLTTRRRLSDDPRFEVVTAADAAGMSELVEERRRRAEEEQQLYAKQQRIIEEKRQQAEATAIEAARRQRESEKRLEEYQASLLAAREQKMAEDASKRKVREQRVQAEKEKAAAEAAAAAQAAAEHEARAAARLASSRSALAITAKQKSVRKAEKVVAATALKEKELKARTEAIRQIIDARQKKVKYHEDQEELERQASLRAGIERHQRVDEAVCEVDRQQGEFAQRTLAKLEAKGEGNAVREKLLEQRRRQQAEHAKMVASAKEATEVARSKAMSRLIEVTEQKEIRREQVLASRMDDKADKVEAQRAKLEEIEERVRRAARKKDHKEEVLRASLEAKDAKFFAQRATLDKLHNDKMALRYKLVAESVAKDGVKPTMREIEQMDEPGPTAYDNRFYEMGQLGVGGKYGRIGTKKAPPSYTMGNASETALPRVLDKSLMIELKGIVSPGPGTATSRLASREVLDKSGKYSRQPQWSMGASLADPFGKEAASKPGPADTFADDRQMSLTRYASAPSFSFATASYQEIYNQDKARTKAAAEGKPGTAPPATRLSYHHPGRYPGPCTYNHSAVQTSLRRHRSLADGIGVSQRFGKCDRFIPIDTKIKDVLGPAKFVKSQNVPGPQKYHPTTSFLSKPLAF